MEENSLPITKLWYRISRPIDEPRRQDAILQMKGQLSMADYHFRVNAERLGVDPLTVATRIEWGEGKCYFVVEAHAAEETLALALDEAVRLIGLRSEQAFGGDMKVSLPPGLLPYFFHTFLGTSR
jgi:hypothetical protein